MLAVDIKTIQIQSQTMNGYLLNWYTDESLTIRYDFNTKITKDITLYAKWKDNHIWKEWKYRDKNHHIRICVADLSHIELGELLIFKKQFVIFAKMNMLHMPKKLAIQ